MAKIQKKGYILFTGGDLKTLTREYSNDRMNYDRAYRDDVHKAVAEKRAVRKRSK
jgi:hypothetical protein